MYLYISVCLIFFRSAQLSTLFLFVGSSFWLPNVLKSAQTCILDLITLDTSSSDEFKELSRNLLELITACACQEQHVLDFYTYSEGKSFQIKEVEVHWNVVIDIISTSLDFNDDTRFYNLCKYFFNDSI